MKGVEKEEERREEEGRWRDLALLIPFRQPASSKLQSSQILPAAGGKDYTANVNDLGSNALSDTNLDTAVTSPLRTQRWEEPDIQGNVM